MVLRGPHAGSVSGARHAVSGDADVDALAHEEWQRRVTCAQASGYRVVLMTTSDPDSLCWIGQKLSMLPHCGMVTLTIEACRGPARADDPAIVELSTLLRQHEQGARHA